jgi:hypothetical protein
MTIDEMLKKYGSQAEAARAFGVTRAFVNRWVKAGEVPEKYRLRELHREVMVELENGEQNRSTARLLRKMRAGLRA